MALSIFGRAAITLGIGPHSSLLICRIVFYERRAVSLRRLRLRTRLLLISAELINLWLGGQYPAAQKL